ncbi:hypothetical protein M0811_10696 [Anaeramoeba ignava]|uniref:Uncharacterized protein n=1 Tax=Anaeramoeba ignava TaxID=1746090 RepID=A0A9Q0LCI9_ANAIG|nr:hypothetical protein M0811_10696 [Anaeramoeba ignava]
MTLIYYKKPHEKTENPKEEKVINQIVKDYLSKIEKVNFNLKKVNRYEFLISRPTESTTRNKKCTNICEEDDLKFGKISLAFEYKELKIIRLENATTFVLEYTNKEWYKYISVDCVHIAQEISSRCLIKFHLINKWNSFISKKFDYIYFFDQKQEEEERKKLNEKKEVLTKQTLKESMSSRKLLYLRQRNQSLRRKPFSRSFTIRNLSMKNFDPNNQVQNNQVENNQIENNQVENNQIQNNQVQNNQVENNQIQNNQIQNNQVENNQVENNQVENNQVENNQIQNNQIQNNQVQNNQVQNNQVENNQVENSQGPLLRRLRSEEVVELSADKWESELFEAFNTQKIPEKKSNKNDNKNVENSQLRNIILEYIPSNNNETKNNQNGFIHISIDDQENQNQNQKENSIFNLLPCSIKISQLERIDKMDLVLESETINAIFKVKNEELQKIKHLISTKPFQKEIETNEIRQTIDNLNKDIFKQKKKKL